jgi:two-component system, chemotaxis family, response regulator PixG
MNNFGTFTKLRPSSLLRHLYSASESTCLQVHSNSVTWSIYLEQGRITYATHSIEPFDRLERHLRRLSYQINSITGEVRVQLRLMFEPDAQAQSTEYSDRPEQTITPPLPAEYQAICWLVSERYLHSTQAAMLIQELVKEVLEAYLSIQQGTYQLTNALYRVPIICKLDAEKIVERCQQRLNIWRSLAPHISSPYQRPYLVIKTTERNSNNISGLDPSLIDWMKGFSLRHLAVIVNQDELVLSRNLYPYIANGTILLHEPDPPFDKLPTTYTEISQTPIYLPEPNKKASQTATLPSSISGEKAGISTKTESLANRQERVPASYRKETVPELTTSDKTEAESEKVPSTPTTSTVSRRIYKVVSVDDSPTILREISRFLEDESFSVVTISDPLKAVMTIIRHKPDLILLDLNMDGMDGYELCRLVLL